MADNNNNNNEEGTTGTSSGGWDQFDPIHLRQAHMKMMRRSRIWSGSLILLVGILLLAYKMGAPIPGWLFTWPVLLMAVGLLVAIKSGFRNPGGFIMILIGAVFFADRSIPGIDIHNYILPLILMVIGISFILRPNRCDRHRRQFGGWHRRRFGRRGFYGPMPDRGPDNISSSNTSTEGDNAEYISVNAVFGGVKKNIQSKNFKGGDVTSFMGGAEINFMQADIQHPIELEVNNVFGGTKLIIPSNWDVRNEISAVFGGVEDKRNFNNSASDTDKRILLKGACVFGGVEVTNY
jgi:predicted membrane protein